MVEIFHEYNQVKITVIKRFCHKKIVKKYTDYPDWRKCTHFKEGQEFMVNERTPWVMPDGFCGWAWADIQKIVWAIARGGPDKYVTLCTDGYRPVLFLLEKIKKRKKSK